MAERIDQDRSSRLTVPESADRAAEKDRLIRLLLQDAERDRVEIADAQSARQNDRRRLAQLAAEIDEARALIAQLEAALVSARRIGAAIGVMMAAEGLNEDEAFDALRKSSQTTHRKLRYVAESVLASEGPGSQEA